MSKRKCLIVAILCILFVLASVAEARTSENSRFWMESGWNGNYSFTVNAPCEAVYTYNVIGPMPNYFAYRLFANTGEPILEVDEPIFEVIVWDFYHTAGIIRPNALAGLYRVQVYSVNGSWIVTAACEDDTGIENGQ